MSSRTSLIIVIIISGTKHMNRNSKRPATSSDRPSPRLPSQQGCLLFQFSFEQTLAINMEGGLIMERHSNTSLKICFGL